ncbi:hypothetical protein [Streptomyces yaizuensis]|uniref:hypothetical protein n=1 Tax=Streptomyces yaizuensis TaxID=2989713 RepID=UPI00389B2A95
MAGPRPPADGEHPRLRPAAESTGLVAPRPRTACARTRYRAQLPIAHRAVHPCGTLDQRPRERGRRYRRIRDAWLALQRRAALSPALNGRTPGDRCLLAVPGDPRRTARGIAEAHRLPSGGGRGAVRRGHLAVAGRGSRDPFASPAGGTSGRSRRSALLARSGSGGPETRRGRTRDHGDRRQERFAAVPDSDPKDALRIAWARQGRLSQFVSLPDDTDSGLKHRAGWTRLDVFRQFGAISGPATRWEPEFPATSCTWRSGLYAAPGRRPRGAPSTGWSRCE